MDLAEQVAEHGVDVITIVIGDDENLDTAEALGMIAVEQENVLGRKINDGFEVALSEGADYVCFIGSDQWLHPSYLDDLYTLRHRIRTGSGFAAVDESGSRIALMWLPEVRGCGPKIIPSERIAAVGGRPCGEELMHSLDGSLMEGIVAVSEDFQWRDSAIGSLRYVDFKSPDVQIHPYAKLRRHAHEEQKGPWVALAEHYPAHLVDTMAALYRERVRS